MFPRNFWFISFQSHPTVGFSSFSPYVRSDPDNDVKEPWDKVALEGKVEADFLYATIIGKDILPFACKRFRPIVMPILMKNNKFIMMKSKKNASDMGYDYFSEYLENAEVQWQKYATTKAKKFSIYGWLNYRNKLTNQSPSTSFKVLFTATATYITSCIVSPDDELTVTLEKKTISLKAFIAESKTYFFETNDELEAFYLCAILNSKLVDDWIKPLQNEGDWGERDIHRRPLLLPIPKFDCNNPLHIKISLLAKTCRSIVLTNLDKITSRSIGKERARVREILYKEMKEINDIVEHLIPVPLSK